MPYRKRYTKKKGGRSLTPKQRKEVKRIATAPMERKLHPVAAENLLLSTTHQIKELLAVGQGDTENQRDGDQINVIGGYIKGAVLVGDTTNLVRMTVIRWKPACLPTADQIYETTAIGTNGGMFSPFNHIYRSQFVVIKDVIFDLEDGGVGRQKIFTVNIKKQPKTVFQTSSTTVGTNLLYVIWSSDSLASPFPTVTYRGNISYLDC